MSWSVAQAKQRLSELVRKAAAEPQIISNRGRVVAAVVGEPDVEGFLEWHASRRRRTVEDFVREAGRICEAEGIEIQPPVRRDRSIAMGDTRRARRHQRPV